jgi:hypothetical protein
MKWKMWMMFFAPEGGEGSGEGQKPDGDSKGEKPAGDGGSGGGDDLAGLKSALEKERQAAKELKGQLKELRELSGKGKQAAEELEQLKGKLAEYEFREARNGALAKAVEEAMKDGKSVVDISKAEKLVAKLGRADTLEADVAEIVELLKTSVTEEKKRPGIPGRTADDDGGTTTEMDPKDWAAFRRSNPEGYKRMIEERQKSNKFAPGGR